MAIDRTTIKTWHNELDAMLKDWAAKKGLEFEGGNITYNANEFTYRPKFAALNEDGTVKLNVLEEMSLKRTCEAAGYKGGNPIGKTFLTYEGKRFTITGYGMRKYCWEGILHGPKKNRSVRVTTQYLLNLQKEVA